MNINKENFVRLTEEFLLEVKRHQLIDKSKKSDDYKDTSKGRNRWARRTHSRISTSVADYNKIDMNTFWKEDMLEFGIKVQGETDNYIVTILFENILKEIANQIKLNRNKLEFKCILRALIKVFNSEDVYVYCTCKDFKYRQAYWASKGNYISGPPQFDPGKGIVNPNDTKGAGCKHVNLILANLDWIMKITSVINNYIHYCKDNMENNYAQYIFPKLYNMPYARAVQLTLTDYDDEGELVTDLISDEETINLSNALGRVRTRYKKLPQPSINPRFRKPKEEIPVETPETNELELKFKKTEDDEEEELEIETAT